MPSRRLVLAATAAVALRPMAARGATPDLSIYAPDLSVYAYEDTRQLVALVCDAAALMAQKGEAAFTDFQIPGSRWRYGDYYLFAYATDGTCVFNPAEPNLVGQNLIDIHDIGGRWMIRNIADVARRPEQDADGWVFFLWQDHAQLSPSWKANYIRKVTTPNGKTYALGCGLFNPKTERIFVKQNVNRAVQLLRREGRASFERLHDPIFTLLGSYVFVMDTRGQLLVDPVFPTLEPRDLWDFTDAVGAHVVQDALRLLVHADEIWTTFLMPPPGSTRPSRKALYLRKITLGTDVVFVGSDFFLATPIWMRA